MNQQDFYNSLQVYQDNEKKLISLIEEAIEVHGPQFVELDSIRFFYENHYRSWLYHAAELNFLELARVLIELGVSLDIGIINANHKEIENETPLIAACENGHCEMVDLLLRNGANLLAVTAGGYNCLMVAQSPKIINIIYSYAEQTNQWAELTLLCDTEGCTYKDYIVEEKDIRLEIAKCDKKHMNNLFYKNSSADGAPQGEAEVISEYERLLLFYGPNVFIQGRLFLTTPKMKNFSFLHYAAACNYLNLAKKLINTGVTVNGTNNGLFASKSPLIAACQWNHFSMIELLLSHQAELFKFSEENKNILEYCESVEVFELLLKEIIKRGYFKTHARKMSGYVVNAYKNQCLKGNIEIVERIVNDTELFSLINVKACLNYTRYASWRFTEHSERFNMLCSHLKTYVKFPAVVGFNQPSSLLTTNSYFLLFGSHSRWPAKRSENKSEAVKRALAKIHFLLNNPHDCIKYLQFLDTDFSKYYQHKHKSELPSINEHTYKFEVIDGLNYPIPNQDYIGIKKARALQEFLILLFKQYDIAKSTICWAGGIPNKIADEMAKLGDFFTESPLSNGLLHGKLAHMIQRAIIIYAIQAGAIPLKFNCKGEEIHITLKDILEGFINVHDESGLSVWGPILDSYDLRAPNFHTPHQLSSAIMLYGKEYGINVLSTYLIDSFCKGYLKLFKAITQTTNFQTLTTEEFTRHLHELGARTFLPFPDLIKLAGEKSQNPVSSKDYNIIPKTYTPDESFQVASFQP